MGEEIKLHLVKRPDVCTLFVGCLGIRRLRLFNEALLGKWKWKWLWRYGRERKALWRRVIEVKSGNEWGGWCSNPVLDPYGFGMWRTIRQGWPSVSSHILYEVGDGTRVTFWQDQWSGRVLLLFATSLFWICHNKEASVADLMQFTNGVLHWDLHFAQAIQDWELESMMTFMDTIYGFRFRGIGEDKMC